MEEWKDIPGWEGEYQVSTEGNCRGLDRINHLGRRIKGKPVKGAVNSGKHHQVGLCRNGKRTLFQTHRLVMLTFVGPCPDGMEVCHNNGNALDNRLENLRYDTRRANVCDQVEHGVHSMASKNRCKHGHLKLAPNLTEGGMRNGWKICRSCYESYHDIYYRKGKPELGEWEALANQHYLKYVQRMDKTAICNAVLTQNI